MGIEIKSRRQWPNGETIGCKSRMMVLPVDVMRVRGLVANVACQSPIQLQANVPQLYTPRFNLACAPDDAGAIQEHLLRFEVPAQANVRIELDGIVFGAVGVQSQCNADAANDPCQFVSEADGFTLNSIMDAGTYFLVVKSIPLQTPTVRLEFAAIP